MSLRSEAPEEQKAFYKSAAWQHCRMEYISRVNGLCERCLAKGIIQPGYIVHHKIHLTPEYMDRPDILLNHDNLEYLCQTCHNKEHFKSKRRFIVRADGTVVARET